MLTVETIGRIRREHFIKGKTIKEIARDLKVSRNTVRRVLRSGATSLEAKDTAALAEREGAASDTPSSIQILLSGRDQLRHAVLVPRKRARGGCRTSASNDRR
jgi:predicted transcriptional regulator